MICVATAEIANVTISRGWWRVAAGACARLITTPLKESSVWLLVDRPGGPTLVSGSDQFCVVAQEFEIEGRSQCTKHGYLQAGFARTPTNGLPGRIVHVGAKGLSP